MGHYDLIRVDRRKGDESINRLSILDWEWVLDNVCSFYHHCSSNNWPFASPRLILVIGWPPMNVMDDEVLFWGGSSCFICFFVDWSFTTHSRLKDILSEMLNFNQLLNQEVKVATFLHCVPVLLVIWAPPSLIPFCLVDPYWVPSLELGQNLD